MIDRHRNRLRLSDHDRGRLRGTRRLVLSGLLLGIVGAVAFGVLGFDGRIGFATVLVGVAFGAVVSALWTILVAIVDEARRAPVAIVRIVISIGLFAVGGVLLVIVLGLVGGNG